jgi:hypothetical protein
MSYELRSSGGQAQSAGIDRYWLQGLLHGRKPRRWTWPQLINYAPS